MKIFYGEVCLTCNKKIDSIPDHQFLTPDQIKDIVSGKVLPSDIKASPRFASPAVESAPRTSASAIDEIRQYKGLLDEGIITQEEFDALKKRLLGL
ncbi:MAG: SHOCT domain-containing protein [Candidatus Methanoplasma sp.]|nr:SHOCT domain-containing protein [Candidatus Methanoplasma sp.]